MISLTHFLLNFHYIYFQFSENLMENGSKKSIFLDPINIKKISNILKFEQKFGPTDLREMNIVEKWGRTLKL
jgi:hypothetical protein